MKVIAALAMAFVISLSRPLSLVAMIDASVPWRLYVPRKKTQSISLGILIPEVGVEEPFVCCKRTHVYGCLGTYVRMKVRLIKIGCCEAPARCRAR